jgi:pimeloyl-ACP methyl ester carboxylesterase
MKNILLLLIILFPLTALAQNTETVEITAPDDLTIVGDYYPGDENAVLLLHMLSSRRSAWESLIPSLTAQGWTVLAVDMRGHGQTGGAQNWTAAETDVQVMVDWLREQGAENVAIIGASIGSNLALRGAANDEQVVTAVALSPGLDYRGVTTADAVETLGERPVLLVAERNDRYSADSVIDLFNLSEGQIQVRLGTGRQHGTNMLSETLNGVIVNWLAEHFSE